MPIELTAKQAMRYNRQVVLPEFDISGQEALLSSSVLIIGVGGLGTSAAQSLCGAGLGKLTLVDDDEVETSNLPRQTLFHESQVGMKKVSAAKSNLHQLNSHCSVTAIAQRLDSHSLVQEVVKHDIVLDCTDNLNTKMAINTACYQHQKPLVIGSAIRFEGQILVVDPTRESSCYSCMAQLFQARDLSCTESGILSPVVNIIGLYQSLLAIQYLTQPNNVPMNQLLLFDAKCHQWQTFGIKRLDSCKVCR